MRGCLCLIVIVCWAEVVVSRKWMEGDVRLVGGVRRYMGTVVILHNGKWGSVCDDQWDIHDAYVVCRQLGYTLAVRAATKSEFGLGNRRFLMSQVHCNGSEQRLDECSFKGYNENVANECLGRYRSAGVICGVAASTTTSTTSQLKIVVNETSRPDENVKHLSLATTKTTLDKLRDRKKKQNKKQLKRTRTNSVWTLRTLTPVELTQPTPSLSDSEQPTTSLPDSEINISTEQLISSSTTKSKPQTPTNENVTSTSSNRLHSPTEDNIVKPGVYENASYPDSKDQQFVFNEMQLNASGLNSSINIADTDSTPLCNLGFLSENNTTDGCDVLLSDDPKIENLEIRLKGGRYEWEGYVQVRTQEGTWGTICSDSWTLREAMVTCQQLGEYGKAKQAILTSFFGGTDVPKTIYRAQCIGRESTLASCNLTLSDSKHTCSKKTAVAGVTCSQHLPDLIPSLRDIEDSVRLQDQPLYYLRCAMEENCLASSAYVIKNKTLTWRNNMRRLLRFSTIVHNRGLADFRPYRPRGQWEWHACHMHYHSMEVFAHYDIIDRNGNRLAEGSKASFCLEDTTCDKGVRPQYNCRGFADQGLSVNCSDNYMFDIDCQWIDITDIKPGEYTFKLEVNPTMLVAESNFDNNVVSCRLYYSGYFASVKNCHHESLLDYR